MEKNKGIEIFTLFKDIDKTLNDNLRYEFKDTALTVPQMNLMRILHENKRMKMSELSEAMGLAINTVSGIVDRLEKQNFIERVRSEKDKRVVYIVLADETEVIAKEMHGKVYDYLESIVSKAEEDEIEDILKGLNTLKKLLNR